MHLFKDLSPLVRTYRGMLVNLWDLIGTRYPRGNLFTFRKWVKKIPMDGFSSRIHNHYFNRLTWELISPIIERCRATKYNWVKLVLACKWAIDSGQTWFSRDKNLLAKEQCLNWHPKRRIDSLSARTSCLPMNWARTKRLFLTNCYESLALMNLKFTFNSSTLRAITF